MIRFVFDRLGFKIVKKSSYDELYQMSRSFDDLSILQALDKEEQTFFLENLGNSKAQLRQDIIALIMSGKKNNGYFVEFGAFDGRTLSNTWMLEKKYGWKGILSEPILKLHQEIRKEREAILETRCVWATTGQQVEFCETAKGELSTISQYVTEDQHRVSRNITRKYNVSTISLTDMLAAYSAPRFVDYLSIDTEGSELEILKAFDFSEYSFGFISIEHNYTEDEKEIDALLSRNGYIRYLRDISNFDGWYVKETKHV